MVIEVTCPTCKGDGVVSLRVAMTSNANAHCDTQELTCGTCHGKGELRVTPQDSPRRLWIDGLGENYVETDFGPFRVEGDLYVLDGSGNTVLVEEGDIGCNQCGTTLPEDAAMELCDRCRGVLVAHARLERDRLEEVRDR